MSSPVQPESELQRIEAKVEAIWHDLLLRIGIVHDNVTNIAQLGGDAYITPQPPVVPPVPLITPVTPAEAVAATLKASTGTSYASGLSWNQNQFLKVMDAKALADWCAGVAAQPDCVQVLPAGVEPSVLNSASAGWIVGLSQAGQGIILAIVSGAGLSIPDVDPRA